METRKGQRKIYLRGSTEKGMERVDETEKGKKEIRKGKAHRGNEEAGGGGKIEKRNGKKGKKCR